MRLRTRNPQIAQALANVKIPDMHPPVARVLIGIDETTWIESTSEMGDRNWTVLDGSGAPVGSVKAPRNVRIMTASRANVWAIETDNDGLQHITRYRVQR